MQKLPSASTGTTARFDTANPTPWLPDALCCGPAASCEHRSAVMYPGVGASAITRFTSTAWVPAATPVRTRTMLPADGIGPERVSSLRLSGLGVKRSPEDVLNQPCTSMTRSVGTWR